MNSDSSRKGAGTHLISDMWGIAPHTMDMVEAILKEGSTLAGAVVLGSDFHHFGGNSGFTGIIILAESHISIHTWPERDYVAIDIFMCGKCDPKVAYDYIKDKLEPKKVVIASFERGIDN